MNETSNVASISHEFLRVLAVFIAAEVSAKLTQSQAQPLRPRLLTVDQAAGYLGRTTKAVRHLIHQGSFPLVRTGSRVMFDLQDLDQWIEQNKTRAQ